MKSIRQSRLWMFLALVSIFAVAFSPTAPCWCAVSMPATSATSESHHCCMMSGAMRHVMPCCQHKPRSPLSHPSHTTSTCQSDTHSGQSCAAQTAETPTWIQPPHALHLLSPIVAVLSAQPLELAPLTDERPPSIDNEVVPRLTHDSAPVPGRAPPAL